MDKDTEKSKTSLEKVLLILGIISTTLGIIQQITTLSKIKIMNFDIGIIIWIVTAILWMMYGWILERKVSKISKINADILTQLDNDAKVTEEIIIALQGVLDIDKEELFLVSLFPDQAKNIILDARAKKTIEQRRKDVEIVNKAIVEERLKQLEKNNAFRKLL